MKSLSETETPIFIIYVFSVSKGNHCRSGLIFFRPLQDFRLLDFDFSMYILFKRTIKAAKAGLSGMEKLGQVEA